MRSFTESMTQAKALTLQGRILEATRLIQTGLGIEKPFNPEKAQHRPVGENVVCFSTLKASESQPIPAWTASKTEAVDIEFREQPDTVTSTQSVKGPAVSAPASFTLHEIQAGAQSYNYRLFVPSRISGNTPLSIVVMLHGCKQDAEDFSRGTEMNVIAEREKFMVVYPDQNRQGNSMGCWNWFEPKHQQRGLGEPAMIAALVAKIVAEQGGDASRVYVAGLSAGGAMAALVGQLYPEVFAAVGVHSGLAPAAAHDVASAFKAMRKGPSVGCNRSIALPIIVFQGSADKTVAPANAHAIVKTELDALGAMEFDLQRIKEDANFGGGRKAMRERWIGTEGKCLIESWNVSNAPHAWAGGDSAGSFTDPQGPSASEAMFQFFRLHCK